MNYPHDLNFGTKPDAHERHRILFNGRNDALLLTVLHYLRDEAADCIGRSTGSLRDGMTDAAKMELGAHEILIQVLEKLDALRNKPVEVEV